jgi:hypothetical protein
MGRVKVLNFGVVLKSSERCERALKLLLKGILIVGH